MSAALEPRTEPVPELNTSPLRGAAFRRILLARGLSGLAYQMQAVAVGWQLYAMTNNPLDLGLVGLAQFVPVLLLTLPAGHVADRYDRRWIAAAANAVGATAAITLALATMTGTVTREIIFLLAAMVGAARAFEFPAMASLWPSTVERSQVPRAAAFYSSAAHLSVVIGPALGGILYLLGPTVVYAATAVPLLVAAALVLAVAIVAPPPSREPVTLSSAFAGIRFILSRRELLGAISLDLFAMILGSAMALMPVFARDVLETGPAGLGMLRAAPAVGAVAVALLLAVRPNRRDVGLRLFVGIIGFGMATIVFAVSRNFWLSLAALVVMGATDMVSVVIRQALVQMWTPDAMRGRVIAVNSLFINASNQLGDFRAGVMATWLGVMPAVVIGGASAIALAALWMTMFPALRRMNEIGK